MFGDGLRAAQIIEAVIASSREQRWVDVAGGASRWGPSRGAPVLEVRGLVKEYPGVKALQGVDLDVRAGEVHCLLGPNGAGKSTLIKCVSGAVEPTAGEILFNGEPLPSGDPAGSLAAGVATIYQELDLVEDLTVAESIFLGREPRRGPLLDREQMNRDSTALLERLDHAAIPPRAKIGALRPAARQVVSIARALSGDMRLLIMDEPSAILDEGEIETLFGVVRRLTAEGVGVVYISHRLDEIRRIGDRVTVLADGRTAATGLPATTPTDELVAHMIGRKVEQLYPERPVGGDEVLLDVRDVARLPEVRGVSLQVHAGEVARPRRAGRLRPQRAPGPDLRHRGARRGRGVDGRAGGCRPGSPAAAIAAGLGLAPEDRKSQGLLLDWTARQEREPRRPRPLPPRAAQHPRRARGGPQAAALAQHRPRRRRPHRAPALGRQPAEGRAGALAAARVPGAAARRADARRRRRRPRPRSTG